MIAATNVEPESLIGGLPCGVVSGSGSGRRSGLSGGSIIELSTWIQPTLRWESGEAVESQHAGRPPHRVGRQPPLAPGERIGDYRLLERLGRGGQGDVWKALRREPFVELVALKILKPSLACDPARMAQFRREAERGGRLDGPSLLPVYELGISQGYHFMAMRYVEGITLREVIRDRVAHLSGRPAEELHRLVTLDESEYLRAMTRILTEATEALAHAHAQRVAHRDIKPANILLDNRRPEGVYLCDFGLGRDLEIATAQQMRDGAGTPMYMAPERLLRVTADEIKSDIYSMGVTIFEALTLSRPFQVPEYVTFSALPAFLAAARPRRPGEVQHGFPEDLEAIVLRAMHRDPALRYESADRLAADLLCIASRWTSPSARSSFDPPHRPCARGPHRVVGACSLPVQSEPL
jgi:eukaryotic-like serine/threonine-protein kinase